MRVPFQGYGRIKFTAIREPQPGHMIQPNKFSNSSDFLRFGAVITCRPPNREMHGSSLTSAPTRTPPGGSVASTIARSWLRYFLFMNSGFGDIPVQGLDTDHHTVFKVFGTRQRMRVSHAARLKMLHYLQGTSHTPFCCVPPYRIYHWLTRHTVFSRFPVSLTSFCSPFSDRTSPRITVYVHQSISPPIGIMSE